MTPDELRSMTDAAGHIYVPVASKFIEAIALDVTNEVLVVTMLRGGDYVYSGCSFDLFLEGVNAQSVGSWYNDKIKNSLKAVAH